MRVFLLRTTTAEGGAEGCIAAVANSGKELTPITVDVGARETFDFANPATDATGNTFVLYNPGRYHGVLVLIPNTGGFENIRWDSPDSEQHYSGKHAYYFAELVGPGADGDYTIRQSHQNCTPNCAEGPITTQDPHWNGTDYVP